MELAYILTAIAAFSLILLFLYIARAKGKQPEKPSKLVTISLALVLVGFALGNGESWFGYAIMGSGILLAFFNLIRSLRK